MPDSKEWEPRLSQVERTAKALVRFHDQYGRDKTKRYIDKRIAHWRATNLARSLMQHLDCQSIREDERISIAEHRLQNFGLAAEVPLTRQWGKKNRLLDRKDALNSAKGSEIQVMTMIEVALNASRQNVSRVASQAAS